jgi:hypothetical protein
MKIARKPMAKEEIEILDSNGVHPQRKYKLVK